MVAIIEAGVVQSAINMLQSENEDVRNMAVYVLNRMEEHGAISYPCIIELTDHHAGNFLTIMMEPSTVKLLVQMLENQHHCAQYFAAYTLDKMAKHGPISPSCIIFELTDSTDTLLPVIIQGDAVQLIVNMVQSKDDYVRHGAECVLDRMAEHGVIGHSHMIIGLTIPHRELPCYHD